MASRSGTSRRNLSVRAQTASTQAEIQYADPGGLRRRNLGFGTPSFAVRAGDLSAWPDHPLLEGTSRHSGRRDSTLEGQIRYGSGSRPNGVEAQARWDPLAIWSRQRWEHDLDGHPSRSTTVLVECGPLAIGARQSQGADSIPGSQILSVGWHTPSILLESAWLQRPKAGSSLAIYAQALREAPNSQFQVRFRHVPKGFGHDGLPLAWTRTTAAQAQWRYAAEPLGIGAQVTGLRDSTQAVRARLASEVALDFGELSMRWRTTASENSPATPRWSTRVALAARRGPLSPFAELATADSAANIIWTMAAGTRLVGRQAELSASTSWSKQKGTLWAAGSKTGIGAGPTHLEFTLSASGGWRPTAPLVTQGSLACGW